jgi:hypothetical protein
LGVSHWFTLNKTSKLIRLMHDEYDLRNLKEHEQTENKASIEELISSAGTFFVQLTE